MLCSAGRALAFATGAFEGTVSFGGTELTSADISSDVYVMKLNSTGGVDWAGRHGQRPRQITQTVRSLPQARLCRWRALSTFPQHLRVSQMGCTSARWPGAALSHLRCTQRAAGAEPTCYPRAGGTCTCTCVEGRPLEAAWAPVSACPWPSLACRTACCAPAGKARRAAPPEQRSARAC